MFSQATAKEFCNFVMPTTKKKITRKPLKNTNRTTIVIATPIEAKDTLFPEKVAKAKKMLRNAKFLDPRFGGTGKV
jgi:hypothetical protein